MPVTADFIDYVLDQMAPLGHASSRRMFGGAGLYLDGFIIGILADDQIYLKVDDQNRAEFEAAGLAPFMYERKDGTMGAMSYYAAPEAAIDDADELLKWARLALDASLRSAKGKKKKSRKKNRAQTAEKIGRKLW